MRGYFIVASRSDELLRLACLPFLRPKLARLRCELVPHEVEFMRHSRIKALPRELVTPVALAVLADRFLMDSPKEHRGIYGGEPATLDVPVQGVCGCWRTHIVRAEQHIGSRVRSIGAFELFSILFLGHLLARTTGSHPRTVLIPQ